MAIQAKEVWKLEQVKVRYVDSNDKPKLIIG
ncbi:hypothetical protein FH603_304 [Spirosoma sp. LMG 31447]|uniref:Uncharacterized protein n=1 Tax=Spirosoma utsteinense TaxID=2585773 RepID=A0ABR6W145_9BACT|nr:hypothetical protein [Spirosoma utsteinense]